MFAWGRIGGAQSAKMIKRLRIRNFKSLRDVDVVLDPVTVLIGRSGTGKSNFVYALRFLRDFVTRRQANFVTDWGGWPAVLCATGLEAGGKLSIEVGFDVPGFVGEFTYAISFLLQAQPTSAAFDGERLAIGSRVLFQQHGGKWDTPPELAVVPNPGNPALGLLYGIQEAKIAHLALTQGIGCYDFRGDVLKKGQFDRASGTSLHDNATNYLTTFDGIANDLSSLERVNDMLAALRRLNASITTVELSANRSVILVGHQIGTRKTLSFELRQESEGFRRFLAHLIALYQQPVKQVLLFEEPEKGIYPGALGVLTEHFQAIADRGRSQVILTTHSPELLRYFGPEQIRVVEMEEYESRIGPLAPEQRESLEERLMTADELLTVDEARIDSSGTTS